MSGNTRLQKTYFTKIHHLLVRSMLANKPMQYVVLTYDSPMKSYNKARTDFWRFWYSFSDEFPGCDYFCSFDKRPDGSWYINLLVLGSDLSEDKILVRDLFKFWRLGMCVGFSIQNKELKKFLKPFHTIQLGLGQADQPDNPDEF